MLTKYSQKNPRCDSVEDDHLSFPPAILMLEASHERFHKPSEEFGMSKKKTSNHITWYCLVHWDPYNGSLQLHFIDKYNPYYIHSNNEVFLRSSNEKICVSIFFRRGNPTKLFPKRWIQGNAKLHGFVFSSCPKWPSPMRQENSLMLQREQKKAWKSFISVTKMSRAHSPHEPWTMKSSWWKRCGFWMKN